MFQKNMTITISFLIGMIGITIFGFIFSNHIHFPTLSMPMLDNKDNPGKNLVSCPLRANVGKEMLDMELNFLASDEKQRADLEKIIPIVQSEFLLNADTDDMRRSIQERDFEAIKAFMLKTVNQHSAQPVKSVYFNSFNFVEIYSN